ncbi:MAG: hypothetical protein WKF78_05670 [Candidatus Limnocylindrales bacterium]
MTVHSDAPDADEVLAAALIIAILAAVAMVAVGVGGVVKGVVVTGVLVIVPGLAMIRAAGLPARSAFLAMAIPLSIAIDGLAATALLAMRAYDPTRAMLVVAVVTLLLVLVERRRSRPAA